MQEPQNQITQQTQDYRTFPNLLINGVNPFYLIQTAYNLFDQANLSKNERTFPMYRFQETALILAALYRFVKIAAPSQGGKTTLAELLAAIFAYAFPGENILILSTRQEQAERLLRDIRNKFIAQCKIPELRKLSTDSATTLEIAANRSQIIALPHSINALTGNPARLVIFDEAAKWDKDPATIYVEGVARTGATGGQLIVISSFFGEGIEDPKAPQGFRGSFFHYTWKKDWAQRQDPTKSAVAARFTYHASPPLIKRIEEIKREVDKQGKGYFQEHYLCVPRKSTGQAVFEHSFKREVHVVEDTQIQHKINYNEPLFLCFDPGLMKAAVLGQLDPQAPRLVYLRSWLSDRDKTFKQFVQSVIFQVRKEFPNFYIQYFADVAARKQNDQTNETNVEVLTQVTGHVPITLYQPVEPGIDVMESFMKQVDSFYVSDKCAHLPDAFESGLVCEMRSNIPQRRWAKDGYWEHLGDAARYPVYYLTGGLSVDSLRQSGAYEVEYNPWANPLTGY